MEGVFKQVPSTVLKRDIRLIPVLVDGASMPQSDEHPDEPKPSIRRNAPNLSPHRSDSGAERLIGAVERAWENARVKPRHKREGQEGVEPQRGEPQRKSQREAEGR